MVAQECSADANANVNVAARRMEACEGEQSTLKRFAPVVGVVPPGPSRERRSALRMRRRRPRTRGPSLVRWHRTSWHLGHICRCHQQCSAEQTARRAATDLRVRRIPWELGLTVLPPGVAKPRCTCKRRVVEIRTCRLVGEMSRLLRQFFVYVCVCGYESVTQSFCITPSLDKQFSVGMNGSDH